MSKKYSLGIDLGTSNSALTVGSIDGGALEDLSILQVVGPHTVEARSGLPSNVYIAAPEEFSEDAFNLPGLDRSPSCIVGAFARQHGAQVPDRLVSSAKSWLCSTQVDHREPILPWQSDSVDEKLSPIDATRLYLESLTYGFKAAAEANSKDWSLDNTDVTLTVPASFDEVARSLTYEAAEQAGLGQVTLMEEPQAAFYAWLAQAGTQWRKEVKPGDIILVCDVGGGTSDFSLISVSEVEGDLELERVSVGEHLLLGGDNLDLALAHVLRYQLDAEGTAIDDWQFLALVHACRQAKEALFEDLDLGEVPLSIPSRGSSLFAGSVAATLTRETLNQIALDGFLPLIEPTEMPAARASAGLQEFGLSYETDPVLSKHLARFLSRSLQNVKANTALVAKLSHDVVGGSFLRPTAVLFNGGFFNAQPARERVLSLLNQWAGADASVRELAGARYDKAVAHGAAYYGLNKLNGSGVRVKAGAARSYYIGLETAGLAIPGFVPPLKALCVVPQGMEEGSEAVLDSKEFGLVTGESVTFRFFSSAIRSGDTVGSILPDAVKELEETLELKAEFTPLEGQAAGEVVPVKLHAKVTEMGTLDLWMQHTRSDKRWKLEFAVRTD
ncbi:MAG: Hsp70 family protein [Opitutaceae bacterium]